MRWQGDRRGLIVLTSCALLLLTAACTGGDGEDGGVRPAPSPSAIAQARSTIEATDLADDASVDAVQGLRYTDEGVRAAREALEAGATGDELWAATWVYATSGTDPAPLVPLLTNDDTTIRLMAAGGLVEMGDVRGFDVLVALVIVDEQVAGSHPPVRMSEHVGATLAALTGQDLGPAPDASPQEVAAAASTWANWLETNRASLTFDAETATWSVG